MREREKIIIKILTIICLFFIIIAFHLPALALEIDLNAKKQFDSAIELIKQDKIDDAVKEFKALLAAYPSSPFSEHSHYWIGRSYWMKKDYDSALREFTIIVARFPDGVKAADAQLEIGNYYSAIENPKYDLNRAIIEYLKIPQRYPDSHVADDARFYAARSLIELSNYEQAIGDFKNMIEKNPQSEFVDDAHFYIGLSYIYIKEYQKAKEAFQILKENYPYSNYYRQGLHLLSLLNKSASNTLPRYTKTIGEKGKEAGRFSEPNGVYCNETGNLYISEAGNQRIQRINEKGEPSGEIGNPKKGEAVFKRPIDVWVDKNDDIYAVDAKLLKVYKFDSSGKIILAFGKDKKEDEFREPSSIAVDDEGSIYVADRGGGKVYKFDRTGKFLFAFGNKENKEDRLKEPSDIAIDIRGKILVADAARGMVMKYDKDGRLQQQFKAGSESGGLKKPLSLAADRLGNIYVLDIGRDNIQKFDRDFKFLLEIKNEKKKPKVIDSPGGIAVCPNGEIFISDKSEHRVYKLE